MHLTRRIVLGLVVILGISQFALAQDPPKAGSAPSEIEPLGPANQSALNPRRRGFSSDLEISRDGRHVAAVLMEGSRYVVSFDGKAGAKYDEIANFGDEQTPRLLISPDGKRLAYIGRRGSEQVLVLDEKEGPPAEQIVTAIFSPDSQRFACLIAQASENAAGQATQSMRIICDGQEGPELPYIMGLQFSPDSKRLVYWTLDSSSNGSRVYEDHQPHAEVNSLGVVAFSPDGTHLAYSHGEGVVLDGKKVYGGAVGYQVSQGNPSLQFTPHGKLYFTSQKPDGQLVIVYDGQEYLDGTDPQFSADGQHFAYVKHLKQGVSVIADGKEGLEYDQVVYMGFAPDGRLLYLAMKGNRSFLVIGEEESEAYDAVGSADRGEHGVFALSGARGGESLAVVLGQELPPGQLFTFTEGLKTAAYVVSEGYAQKGVSIVGGPTFAIPAQSSLDTPPVLSPDGSHVAYIAKGTEVTLHLDDRSAPLGHINVLGAPAISPDGKYVAVIGNHRGVFTVVVNGVAGPAHAAILRHDAPMGSAQPPALQFAGDGSLSYIGVTDGQLQRVTIKLDEIPQMPPSRAAGG